MVVESRGGLKNFALRGEAYQEFTSCRPAICVSLAIMIAASLSLFAFQTRAAGDLTPKEARRVIARLAGIELPSDAVRIKSISPMGNSAVVVAQVETAFRLVNDKDKWRVAEIRTGDRRGKTWIC